MFSCVLANTGTQVVALTRLTFSATLSRDKMLHCPAWPGRQPRRLRRLQRTRAPVKRGSCRRGRVKHAIARLTARETDRRKDWAVNVSIGSRAASTSSESRTCRSRT